MNGGSGTRAGGGSQTRTSRSVSLFFLRVRGQNAPALLKTTDSNQFYNPELKDPSQTLTKGRKKAEKPSERNGSARTKHEPEESRDLKHNGTRHNSRTQTLQEKLHRRFF
jgi:hypothetical protein